MSLMMNSVLKPSEQMLMLGKGRELFGPGLMELVWGRGFVTIKFFMVLKFQYFKTSDQKDAGGPI